MKIFVFTAGNTLGSHEKFVKKLTNRGAEVVDTLQESDRAIVFCPIVSRFEPDVESALSSATERGCERVILVAMHHTFDKNYTLPNQRMLKHPAIALMVDCLFFEKKGLYNCSCNDKAVDTVRRELGLETSTPRHWKNKLLNSGGQTSKGSEGKNLTDLKRTEENEEKTPQQTST